MLLFTPLTWEWRVSLVRSGRRRWWPKLGESLRSDHRVLTGVGLLVVLATGLPLWGAPELAAVAAVLVWPLSAWYLVRSTALGGHVLIAWAGSLLLLWATHGSNERLWPGLWVMPGAAVLGLLLVTAHERRLALQRLERHADTDALTSLLSLNGLYRLWDEWADSTAEEGHISPHAPPTLVSVHMSNVDAMEQLLGAHHSDLIERATAGALANTAPKVQWARIAKAHFVGWMGQEVSEGTLRALMGVLRVAAVESNTLHDENTSGHPLWVVAALRVEADPLPPPIEVVMACLRHAEQAAQDSREGVIHRVNQASAHALKLEAEQAEHIRQIIQRQQLVLYAQPIVANQHPEAMPHKYEILVRLHDAQGNCVPPSRFLPVAMRAGLMQWLDMAVMEQTFAWFAAHPQALAQLNHCAINLSGPTVANPVVAQRIQQGLQQHQLPPEKFTFEITESQAIANPAQATETIRAIRSCGCRVAIDDFGTGVATFDYLKRFDVDYIKIDGAFIQSLLNDPVDRVIVESIVKVAHQLQVRTVAEFVATADLHTAVTALGVDESQGFAFGAPRPLHEWFHAS
jgi:EAL domain-containing protein (putative c-di-GMP-specific phosphodiesterase class I)